jgi:hypothetical protein
MAFVTVAAVSEMLACPPDHPSALSLHSRFLANGSESRGVAQGAWVATTTEKSDRGPSN